MHGRFHRCLAAAVAVTGLSGCIQAIRHSNTMLFGTNTTFGLKAGTATGNLPEIVVGFDRQEAVIMPLVANTSSGQSDLLQPCDLTKELKLSGAPQGYLVHPCSLVAYKGGSMDSYSVLASFGAKFSGQASTEANVSGGLAQYFATGMAAQILAAKGGAALVSTGEAAKESAETPTSLATLFPDGTSFAHYRAVALDNSIATLRAQIKDTPADVLGRKINGFLTALAGARPPELIACGDAVSCLAALDENLAPIANTPKFSSAVAGWDSY